MSRFILLQKAWVKRVKLLGGVVCVVLLGWSDVPKACGGPAHQELQKALQDMHAWVDASPHGPAWRDYLQSARLERELSKEAQADPCVVAEVLARYCGEAEELQLAPFARVRDALTQWLEEITGSSWKGLAQQARASQKAFIPFGKGTAQETQARLKASVDALDERLKRAGPNGEDWRRYLAWEELIEQLSRGEQADLDRLDAIYYKFDAGFEGLGLYWFSDVRRSLRDWLIVLRATDPRELEGNYRAVLEALAKELESLGESPSAEQTVRIGQLLGWLRDARQAPWLVEHVGRRFSRPNFEAHVSAEVVQSGLDRPVEDVAPVVDVILGTQIQGTGRTEGVIKSSLLPNPQAVEILLHFTGTTFSTTVGYHGPAQIYTTGQTTLQAEKKLWISSEGLQTAPSVAQAQTQTTIDGIGLVRGGRLVQRIAWKRTCQTKPQAEWLAARHGEQRLQCRLDEQVEDQIADANLRLAKRLRQPLEERRLWPAQVHLCSTDQAIEFVMLEARPEQLAAVAEPPPVPGEVDLVLRVHETMVNNSTASALSGMILTDEHFQQVGQEEGLIGQLFKELPTEREGEPWALYFAHGQPVLVRFRDGKFTVTIHGRAFRRGGTSYPGMDITAEYRIEKGGQGHRAVREGALRIFPPDFEPGRQFSVQEQVLRDLLQRRFEKIFPPEMLPQPLLLPESWKSAGKMELCHWETRDGWLTLAWKRTGSTPASSPKP